MPEGDEAGLVCVCGALVETRENLLYLLCCPILSISTDFLSPPHWALSVSLLPIYLSLGTVLLARSPFPPLFLYTLLVLLPFPTSSVSALSFFLLGCSAPLSPPPLSSPPYLAYSLV